MPIQKSEAIVLRTRDFRETSLIVNFFTKDFGKIHGLIKGIRRTPQRYGGMPLHFSRNHIVFYDKPSSELSLVTQCDVEESFTPIRSDLDKTTYANYFVELLDAVTQNSDKNEELYGLMLNALQALAGPLQCNQVARIFEIKLLNLSGFKPRLDACVNCQGRDIHQGRFSARLGGILCELCLNKDPGAKTILKGTIASIEYIEKSQWQKSLQLRLSPSIGLELEQILRNFLEVHLEKESNARKFLIS